MENSKDYLVIGRIVRPFGIKGELKVLPLTDSVDRFTCIDYIYIKRYNEFFKKQLDQVRMSMDFVLMKLQGVDSRTDSEKLRNLIIYIDREHAADIDEDSHYYCDIEGCTVKTVQGEIMGTVVDIQNAGSCDVYSVRRNDSSDGELLIPAVRDVIKNIDTQRKEILIEIVEGLL